MAEAATTQGRVFTVGMSVEANAGVAVIPTQFPELISEGFMRNPNRQDITGLNGSRSHHSQATAEGNIDARGAFSMNARKQWLRHILYWTLGGGNENAPTLAETVKTFTAEVDTSVRVLTYAGCKIGTLELTSESNNPLIVNVSDVIAMSVADAVAGTATSPTRTITNALMMHHALTLTVDGSAMYCNSYAMTINNALEDDHFQNSVSRVAIPEGDRIITGSVVADWSVLNAVTRGTWTKFVSGATASLSAAYSDGTNTLTFTMPRVHYHEGDRPPSADSRGTIFDTIPFQAKSSNAGLQDELTVAWS